MPLNFARMQRKVSHFLEEDKIEELTLYLKRYLSKELEEYYKQFGNRLFSWAVSYAKTSHALSFLLLNVPKKIVLNILWHDNFYFLKRLINVKSIIDKERGCSHKEMKLIAEKIKLVLELKDEKINSAIHTIVDSEKVTENIRTCIKSIVLNEINNMEHQVITI